MATKARSVKDLLEERDRVMGSHPPEGFGPRFACATGGGEEETDHVDLYLLGELYGQLVVDRVLIPQRGDRLSLAWCYWGDNGRTRELPSELISDHLNYFEVVQREFIADAYGEGSLILHVSPVDSLP